VVLSATCNGAYFMRHPQWPSQTLAEVLLGQPGGGTPAFIGSSTYTNSGPHVEFMGELLSRSGEEGMRWGDALRKTRNWAAGRSQSMRDLGMTEQLLGDPALPVEGPAPEEESSRAVPPPKKF